MRTLRQLSATVLTMSQRTRPPNRNVTNRTATRSLAMASSIDMGSPRKCDEPAIAQWACLILHDPKRQELFPTGSFTLGKVAGTLWAVGKLVLTEGSG